VLLTIHYHYKHAPTCLYYDSFEKADRLLQLNFTANLQNFYTWRRIADAISGLSAWHDVWFIVGNGMLFRLGLSAR
jgi:hypothetical protein